MTHLQTLKVATAQTGAAAAATVDAAALLLALQDAVEVDSFLVKWPRLMARAGYLALTTAKREDCIRSYHGFLHPLWSGLEAGAPMDDFAQLLQREDDWAQAVLEMSRRHRLRGITLELFIGCFKTLVQAVTTMILEKPAPAHARSTAARTLRAYADAMEVVILADWRSLAHGATAAQLDESNRQLTLQKNRFENIFATTSDLVLVTDAVGRIEEANGAARALLGDAGLHGRPIWMVLSLDAASMPAVLRRHPISRPSEVILPGHDTVLELRIAPLSTVSLASSGYLFLLSDVTGHVRLRAELEQRVRERTAELELKSTHLEEMNVTLRNVLASIEGERQEYRRSVAQTVQTTLLPALKVLQSADDPGVRRGYAGVLGDQLLRLCEGGGSDARLLSLTPTELKICRFIQSGSRTKEIADSLHLSAETVQTHRKAIRRKLQLSGKERNLTTFLQTVCIDG